MATGRQTLTMAITLEGADKVETDLSKLGPAAEKAFAEIQKAAERAGVGLDRRLGLAVVALRTRLAALQAVGARLATAFNGFTASVARFGNAVAASARRIGLLTAALGLSVAGVGAFARSIANNAEHIDNQSKALGISAQAYQNFANAAVNAGESEALLEKFLKTFVLTAGDAADASGDVANKLSDAAKSMRKVEVTLADGSKKFVTVRGTSDKFAESITKIGKATGNTEKDMIEFAKRITAITDPTARFQALIDRGFSKREAVGLVTILRGIAQDADPATRALNRILEPLSDLEIAIGLKMDAAFDRFGTNLRRVRDRVGTILSPAVTIAFEKFADILFKNSAVLEKWAKIISDEAVKAVQGLIKSFEGVTADDIDQAIGKIKESVIDFGKGVKFAIFEVIVPAFKKIGEIATFVADTINSVFGTKLTGTGLLVGVVVLQMVGAFSLLASVLGIVAAAASLLATGLGALGAPFVVAIGAGILLENTLIDLAKKITEITSVPFPIALWISQGFAIAMPLAIIFWEEFWLLGVKAGMKLRAFFESGQFTDWIEEVKTDFGSLWDVIGNLGSLAFEALKSTAESVMNAISGFISGVIEKVKDLIDAIREAVSARESAGESGGGGGYAQGGSIRGPGSGTSDSIPIWASNGEFMINARAVRKWGVGFFSALNGLRMPKGGLRFNTGGLVHAMAPRFPSSGPVATREASPQGRAVVVNFGGESFEMSASDSVVHKLMKAATGKQIRSNGRKPAWYGA